MGKHFIKYFQSRDIHNRLINTSVLLRKSFRLGITCLNTLFENGIKICILCDSDYFYMWNCNPYLGTQCTSVPEKNQVLTIVLILLYSLSGHIISCDNFIYILAFRSNAAP